ncbi:MAG TPA: M48 family metalloprotease [Fibrobacteria bacterium]|nr:M48 family metalloprotease [Fibrobacteria bacterium]
MTKVPKAKLFLPLALCAVLLTRCSCDFFGTTGALLISEEDEKQLGLEFDTQLRDSTAAYPVYNPGTDPDKLLFKQYVTDLAQEILAKIPASGKPGYKFTFTIIDKDVENAFAVPGGYVYIYTGIIKKMKNEAELAGVLGHEIAHVTRHHYRDAMAKQTGLSLLLQALLGDNSSQIAQLVAGSFSTLAGLQVSQGNESEADFYGTKYIAAVNRNPLGIATFFSRFKNEGSALTWFSTHPASSTRVEDVTEEVNGSAGLKALAADSTLNFQSRFEANTKAVPKN